MILFLFFQQSFGGQPGRGQNEVVGSQLEYDRSRRNRSLDRSTELEQFNSTYRGSSRALAGQSGGIGYSGSTTHLNLQLGPLQLPPRGYGHSYQLADCKLEHNKPKKTIQIKMIKHKNVCKISRSRV